MKKYKYIPISELKAPKEPPLDDDLMELLDWASTQKVPYQKALVNAKLIRPHTNYVPKIRSNFDEYFTERVKAGNPALVLIYEKGDKFIMSDNYNSFYFYKRNNVKKIPCSILGKYKKGKGVEEFGGPYQEGELYAVILDDEK